MFATICLLTMLFVASGLVWRDLAKRAFRRQPLLAMNNEPRARWQSIPELIGVYVALLWLVLHLFSFISAPSASPPAPISLDSVAKGAAVNFGLCLILPYLLISAGLPWSGIGLTTSNWGDQCRIGIKWFLAAVLPMAISMFTTLPIRSLDRQHSLLKLLADSPDVVSVAVVAVTAVLSAPLLEELLFRVILQGWFTTLFPAPVAISLVAVSFSLVHGWRDGLALLPLAFILGYVFHRRHSYLSVVMIHALFNATMLALQLLNPQIP